MPPGDPLASWKRATKAKPYMFTPLQLRHSPRSLLLPSPHTGCLVPTLNGLEPQLPAVLKASISSFTVQFCGMDTVLTPSEKTLLPPMLGLCVAFMISFLHRNNLEKTLPLSPHRCALGQIPDVYPFHHIKHPCALLPRQQHNGQSLVSFRTLVPRVPLSTSHHLAAPTDPLR